MICEYVTGSAKVFVNLSCSTLFYSHRDHFKTEHHLHLCGRREGAGTSHGKQIMVWELTERRMMLYHCYKSRLCRDSRVKSLVRGHLGWLLNSIQSDCVTVVATALLLT